MVIAIGPCFLLAPVVAVLAVLAIPLWPVCLLALLVMLVVVWPIEQLCRLLGLKAYRGASATVWRWLRWMSVPWTWFDVPAKKAAANAPDAADAPSADTGTGTAP